MKKKVVKHFNLKEIKNPNYVKSINMKDLDFLCADIRNEIIASTSKNGGHLSSNLGVVEATVALCRVFDFNKDKIIFDVGHQCYTYKILTGRSLDDLRQKNGVSGFQKMDESKYDHYEAGHCSTSIAAANGFAFVRDLNKEHYEVISFIGDGAIANGLAFESINATAIRQNKIIIVLNDNDMSISNPVGRLSNIFRKAATGDFYLRTKKALRKIFGWNKLGRIIFNCLLKFKNWFKSRVLHTNMFDNLGFAFIGPIDGHNIKQLCNAFERAKKINKSCVVHIKTQKGKGFQLSEHDSVGNWHGVAPFNIQTGETLSDGSNTISWSNEYANFLDDEMSLNKKLVVLVPGTGLGSGVQHLIEKHPSRAIDVGISEEYSITLASGIAVSGYHPVVSMYSTFLQRSYDELSHDIARMNLDATILIDRAGLVGNDGNTHQGIYDEGFLFTIPNTTICMASDSNIAKQLLHDSTLNHGLYCIRYPRCKVLYEGDSNYKVKYGKWKNELEGKDVAIISVGPLTLDLKNLLINGKKDVTLINAIYQRPIDKDCLKNLLDYKSIIIYDAYATDSGFVNEINKFLLNNNFKGNVICKTVPNTFVDAATIHEQLESFKLLPQNIFDIL